MKPFGFFLIVAAIFCGIMSAYQTKETHLEELTGNVISSSSKVLEMNQGFRQFIQEKGADDAETPGVLRRVAVDEAGSRSSLIGAQQDMEGYRKERNQRMLVWLAGAGVCFLAGLMCVVVGAGEKKEETKTEEKTVSGDNLPIPTSQAKQATIAPKRIVAEPRYNYLFVVLRLEDVALIDIGIQKKGDAACYKLGANTYLGEFWGYPTLNHDYLKREFGILGEVRWVPFPEFEVTR